MERVRFSFGQEVDKLSSQMNDLFLDIAGFFPHELDPVYLCH